MSEHSFLGDRFRFLVLVVLSAPPPVGHSSHLQGEHQVFGPVCKEPTKCSRQRFPFPAKAHLHCCKLSVSKNSSHMWHTWYNVPSQCMLFCEEGMGLVTFYRGWKRGSKLPRSGVSHGGALGNRGLPLFTQRRSILPPAHPKPLAKCTFAA